MWVIFFIFKVADRNNVTPKAHNAVPMPEDIISFDDIRNELNKKPPNKEKHARYVCFKAVLSFSLELCSENLKIPQIMLPINNDVKAVQRNNVVISNLVIIVLNYPFCEK